MKKYDAFAVLLIVFLLNIAFGIFMLLRAYGLAQAGDLALLEDDEMLMGFLDACLYDPKFMCAFTLSLGVIPFLYAALRGIPFGAFFRLKRPAPAMIAKCLLLMAAAIFLSGVARVAVYAITGTPLKEENAIAALSGYPRPLVFLTIAILPAVCEEILFRGFILSALRKDPDAPLAGFRAEPFAILLCSLLFAASHMELLDFLSIFILGLALSCAACATGSLAIPMILHCFNNGLSLVLYWLFPDFAI